MKNLIIIGAGGFGREVLGYAMEIPSKKRDWELRGFLDDNPDALNGYNLKTKIISSIKEYIPQDNDVFICALGDPKKKLSICYRMGGSGAKFINLIHPTAVIGSTSVFGEGLIMAPYSVITENVTLGKFNTINVFSVFGHDTVAGDGCTLSPHCSVAGFVTLGKAVFLGTNASILPSKKVDDYVVVGAGSIVVKNIKPGVSVFGNPAKIIGSAPSSDES